MTPSERFGSHLRRNVVGYLALFVALTGTSYAANKIKTNQIARNAITSKLIKDGQVKSGDVADDGLTGTDIKESTLKNVPVLLPDGSVTTAKLADSAVSQLKLSFDPATQAELDAYRAQVATAGTINDPANPVHFSKLRGVPAGFADGTDDTGAAPGVNSLAEEEPGTAAEDEIRDGAIDSEDIADGTIDGSDISPAAAIPDSALSPSAALLNRSPQSFTGTNNFGGATNLNGNLNLSGEADASFGNAENFVIQASRTGSDATTPFQVDLSNDSTSGLQRAAHLANLSGTGATEFLLSLGNADDTPVGSGIQFFGGAGGFSTGINAADSAIGTALAIGNNDITTSGATISSTELERLDGPATRSVGIPITSFVNVDDNATLDFTASDGTSPDFGAAGDKPYIEWDDDTDGGGANIADVDKVAAQFVVPADFGSNGRIRLIYREFSTASVPERVICDAASNDGSFGAPDTASAAGVPAVIGANLDPVVTYLDGNVITLRCNVDDGSGGTTADDVVRLFSAAFTYEADN